ncbi:hypothetical protein RFN29_27505 [Mesorhizobium sp. VK22B]|uniref:Uncharacterized protein n=1 Tax=Mesorhizobium captivum TaxID=3072319 RepID=A0ABU4Z7Q8_9HYPH|nr:MULTISPECIES: hypothetical protein [unclassified Mesorhizobium]MDX8495310.1 hypothetical protein [Mesorhizobium sp. VK22B]MDX8508717.1 hypothetical protein [Mesorhizobium sp. VK22E]
MTKSVSNPGQTIQLAPRLSVEAVEEGAILAPRSNADGPIPVLTTDAGSGEVLMIA